MHPIIISNEYSNEDREAGNQTIKHKSGFLTKEEENPFNYLSSPSSSHAIDIIDGDLQHKGTLGNYDIGQINERPRT